MSKLTDKVEDTCWAIVVSCFTFGVVGITLAVVSGVLRALLSNTR